VTSRQVEQTAKRRGPGRPNDNFEPRKDEIIRVCTRLFAEKGFHGTSMADICEATNIGRGVLYHYIDSKEDILAEIHSRFVRPLLEQAEREVREAAAPDERLRRLSRVLLRTIAAYRDEVTVYLHEAKALTGVRREQVHTEGRRFEWMVRDAIAEGQRMGLFQGGDPKLMALAFLGMHNYSYRWLDPAGPHSADEIAALFSDTFLAGIRVAPDPRPA
jgi:AcrR family transcriptional regulator